MGKLTDILSNGDADDIRKRFRETEPAGALNPLPNGEYITHIVDGELTTSRTKGTPGYTLTFQVLDGELKGRRVWHTLWLTPDALPFAKRDLGKIGVTDLEQLERPLPARVRCRVAVALRRDDHNVEYNSVRRFDVIGIDESEMDAFAPKVAEVNGDGHDDGR